MAKRPQEEPQAPAPIIDPVELGDRLRATRVSRGLSIRDVAQEIGVSAPTLSRVERGQHLPERENLLRIARWAGVRLDPVLHPGDARQLRNQLVHAPDASTIEAVEMHLRADKDLSRSDAESLSELFRVAYHAVSGKAPGKKGKAK